MEELKDRYEIIEEAATDAIVTIDEKRRRGKSAPVVEVTGVHKSGKQVQLELSLGEYKKNNKHIYTGIIRDIASRKHTDRRLAAQFAVTRALAESSSLSEA